MKRYLPLLAILALLGAFAAQVATASAASPAGPRPDFAPLDLGQPVEIEDEEEGGEEFDDEIELEECGSEDFGLEFDEEEGEEELSAAEEAEIELEEEECESSAKDGKGSRFVSAPAACKVSRAESTILALPGTDQVRLTVRYRTWAPTPVKVALQMHDGKGSIGIAKSTESLRGRGVLRITTDLGDSVMDRALRASEFDVSLVAPKTPSFCASALKQRLRATGHASPISRRLYSSR